MRPPSDLRRRFGVRTIAALAISVVALVFVIISLTTAWWTISFSMTQSGQTLKGDTGYTLGGSCSTLTFTGVSLASSCSAYGSSSASLGNVFLVAFVMMLLGLILTILALVFLLVGVLRPRIGMAGFVLAMVGSILVLVAPIYIFAAAPGAANGSSMSLSSLLPFTMTPSAPGFFGSGSVSITYLGSSLPIDATFGGGIGWFAAIVSFVLLLVATILTLSAMRWVKPLGNYIRIPMAPYGYQQPAGQPGMVYGQQQPGYAPQPAHPSGYPYYGAPPAQPAAQPPQQPAAPATPPSPAESKCPSCGATISPGTVTCPACGAKV